MKTPKIAILETLGEMDDLQAQKVLEYIKSILNSESRYGASYRRFKKDALLEIRRALRKKDSEFGLTA